jgi:hypothetical protein
MLSKGAGLTPPWRVENPCRNPAEASIGLRQVTTPQGDAIRSSIGIGGTIRAA